jgi:hypothetical protein
MDWCLPVNLSRESLFSFHAADRRRDITEAVSQVCWHRMWRERDIARVPVQDSHENTHKTFTVPKNSWRCTSEFSNAAEQ